MILKPPRDNCTKMGLPAEKWILVQKNALSYRKMGLPAEKWILLQKNAVFGRKSQEGFKDQESRTLASFHKNVS